MPSGFPVSVLLIPYGIIVAYTFTLSLMNLHHLARFGTSVATAKMAAFTWLVGTAAVVTVTFGLLQETDWQHPIEIDTSGYGMNQTQDFDL
ncbi:hypothetical protein JW899_00870 [Candidatus Uhrbacteria bacterium]|nr:hypothetical protein [Candidatus Uhrbacteria bacterium]